MEENRFSEAARLSVGSVLLFRESKNGGSYGSDIDKRRAARVADAGLNGDEVYELLLAVATKAVENAESESRLFKAIIVNEVRRLAEQADSLAMHRFIEKKAAE